MQTSEFYMGCSFDTWKLGDIMMWMRRHRYKPGPMRKMNVKNDDPVHPNRLNRQPFDQIIFLRSSISKSCHKFLSNWNHFFFQPNTFCSFLLLLPRQIISDSIGTCYEEYVQDANRHYKVSTWISSIKKYSITNPLFSTELDSKNVFIQLAHRSDLSQ